MNFWATWCAPCRKEFPSLERAWKKLAPAGVSVLAVDMGDTRESVERFLRRISVSFPILLAPDPALVGKTASHGCVRLTNWDARELADAVKSGAAVEFVS